MGKEFKIGVAVIGTVAIAFGTILYQRVNKLKTTATVAKNESKADKPSSRADKLFAASNQLDTESGDEADSANRGFKWNSKSGEEPATESAAVEAAPPRASFLPKEEPAADDRYGSRYADAADVATDTASDGSIPEAVAETAPADDAPIGRIVADTPDVNATEEPTPSIDSSAEPSSVSNPFARTSPAAAEPAMEEPATQPIAAQPGTEEVAAADVADDAASDLAQPRSIAIVQPNEAAPQSEPAEIAIASEPAPPARLDTSTVPTGAISDAPRPTSRFITPEDEAPPADTSSRYSDSFAQPTPRVHSPSAVNSIAGGTHRLGPNENFWTVSEQAYGTGGYFKALHAYNAEQHPIADDLAVGDEIRVPEKSELERQFPALCPKPGRRSARDSYAIQASAKLKANGETYVVQEGDTLFDIARYELGKAARWAELYELNRDAIGNDIDFLRPGMELILPSEDERADSVTRQPGGSLR